MSRFAYNNFVRSTPTLVYSKDYLKRELSGTEARRIYLEEISSDKTLLSNRQEKSTHNSTKKNISQENIDDKGIVFSAQNNDTSTLMKALDRSPDKVNLKDEFGWTLLMIACQANSADIVIELLRRGADTSHRDKAGNSAQSLIIRNKNTKLADIYLKHNNPQTIKNFEDTYKSKLNKQNTEKDFVCEVCNSQSFKDRDIHLSSIIHNINLSKHTKCHPWYAIPETNKGYQIMLKEGWDRSNGLGRDGSGKKYPIRPIRKLDRKGLGHENSKLTKYVQESIDIKSIKLRSRENDNFKHKRMEINFRREFY